MTQSEFNQAWTRIKALWTGWAAGFNETNEVINIGVTFKMFSHLSPAAVNEAVDQHFAEKGSKKASAFEPVFSRILELAKGIHWANQQADPMRQIHQTWVSMLPRMVQLEREVEWHRRMATDDSVSQSERERHSAVAALGSARLQNANTFATQEALDKCVALEAAQTERANRWRQEQIDALRNRNPDQGVREHVRAIPEQLSRPSSERKRQSQSIGQAWK